MSEEEHTGESLVLQVQRLVEQELARIGVRGVLRVDDLDALVLRRGAHEARAEIRGTLAQWDSLPDDLRERRIRQISELLAQPPMPSDRIVSPARPVIGVRWFSLFAPLAVVALTAVTVTVAYRYLAPSGGGPTLLGSAIGFGSLSPVTSRPSPPDPDRERFLLGSAACAQTRARVARGANVGPADSEGWVVELVFLRRGTAVDLSRTPGLSKFVTRQPGANTGVLTWPLAAHLNAARRFDAEVTIIPTPALGADRLSGVRLIFSGPYVVPYFTDDQRGDYFKLADALAEELDATDGALFAHCANSESHQIGSWFLGASPAAAVASLVYFMASYSEVPTLKPDVLEGPSGLTQRDHSFDAIGQAANGLDRSNAAALVGRELGMISGRPEHTSRISFPFRDANRAARASVTAARALGLAHGG